MSTVNTPKVNRIYRMTEFDQLRTAIKKGNMYICTDSLQMYYDESAVKRSKYTYTGIKTINDLMYNTTPNYGTSYYCWEDNSLWLWLNKWITLWSDTNYPSAYIYTTYPTKENPGTLNSVYNINNVLDNNGLLQDGSVVIRDGHRIIKGKLFVNEENDNLTFSSFLGGGIRLLPNGEIDTNGELFIGDEGNSFLRSSLSLMNNEGYVDYSEHPELDTNPYKNDSHKYKVYHEGNLDTSAILEMTPEQVYQKLQDKSLPDPLDLSVSMISGKTIDDLALKEHTHLATDITNFNEEARNQAAVEIRTVMTGLTGEGVTVSTVGTNNYKLSANNFTLTLGGGVTGSAVINHLSDTTVNVTVDPTKHIHENYVTRMDDLQSQINDINAMDKNDYYTISQVDNLLDDVKGTTTPTPGKPLLIDSNNKLPATATASDKLSITRTITFQGDITGILSTDFSQNSTVELDASNIVSVTPVTGKALLIDSNGNLPGNAQTASALNHTIMINLNNEVTGSGQLDTSKNSVSINATLNPGDNILQTKDLGVTVANLDENGLIPENLIPLGAGGGLTPQGTFIPSNGYPSDNPHEGDFWIASTGGTLNGETYAAGDWCLYIDGDWTHIAQSNTVTSVNGKEGAVVLTADDVDAVSSDYINYNIGQTIPSGYVVRTSDDGIITGASVEKLTNEFEVTTDLNSDIEVATNSTNPSTDGSTDLGLNLQITETGLNKIQEETGYVIQNNSVSLQHRQNLNFAEGFTLTDNGSDTITINSQSLSINDFEIIYITDTAQDINNAIEKANDVIDIVEDNPILFVYVYEQDTNVKSDIFVLNNIDENNISLRGSCITELVKGSIAQYSINETTNYMNITLQQTSNGKQINSISFSQQTGTISVLPTNTLTSGTTAFMPTQPYQPATKQYVDNQLQNSVSSYTTLIGDGTNTTYRITHNLNATNVIVQLRDGDTMSQIYTDNRIIDSNVIEVQFSTPPKDNGINVCIIGI